MDGSSFPWELLPNSIQEEILSKLPISVLVRLKSVSHSFLSSIQSLPPSLQFPRDPFFLLYYSSSFASPSLSYAIAFQPYHNRWLSMAVPSLPAAASGHLLLLPDSLFNPFSGASTPIPPPLPMPSSMYPLSLLIDGGATHSSSPRIVVVTTSDRIRSQIYDTASGGWTLRGELPGLFHMLGNAVFLDGFLYVLSHGPDHLLRFDLLSGDWEIMSEVLPSVARVHLVTFGGRLFLVGGDHGIEFFGGMISIKVWEFVRKKGEDWELVCSMPDEIFSEFSGMGRMLIFHVCDRKGMVCFFNFSEDLILILDLMDWRWWGPRKCPWRTRTCVFLCLAVEPNAELLM